jgi:hypothetical protein
MEVRAEVGEHPERLVRVDLVGRAQLTSPYMTEQVQQVQQETDRQVRVQMV